MELLARRDRAGTVARVAVVALALALFAVRVWYGLRIGNWLWLMLVTAGIQFTVILAGLVAAVRRPDSRVGLILLAWGAHTLVVGLGSAESGALLVLWYSLSPWYWALLAHAMLTYPDGRTHSRAQRWFLVVAYSMPLWWFAVTLVSPSEWLVGCPAQGCPANPVLVEADRSLSNLWFTANNVIAIGMAVWFVALVLLRYRRMVPAQRRSAAPALLAIPAILVAYLMLAVLSLLQARNPVWWETMSWIRRLATGLVPIGLVVGLVGMKLARADVATLLVRLRDGDADELQTGLARLLRDPSLRIVATVADGETGEVTELGDGLFLVHHPSARTEDPELFDAGVAAARMALDNARLAREVQAQLAEVRASRERLLHTAERERRRMERDLHDGAQQQLIGLGMALQSARLSVPDGHPAAPLLDDATGQLRESLDELRSLARGLRPALLTERGLAAALADLRRRVRTPVALQVNVGRRLSAAVESTAYYVVSEALQNVVRHAAGADVLVRLDLVGDELVVSVRDDGPGGADGAAGSGLRGLADRVAATGGELTVASPPGAGTTVVARLPATPAER